MIEQGSPFIYSIHCGIMSFSVSWLKFSMIIDLQCTIKAKYLSISWVSKIGYCLKRLKSEWMFVF